jgi:monothiol glutaredoxin
MSEERARIEGLIQSAEVVLFLKGTRASPQCGFSARVVDALDEHLEDYAAFDVTRDEALREGLKRLSDWPTFPQLFVRGRLVGGTDIVEDLKATGELAGLLGVSGPRALRVPEIAVSDAAARAFVRYAGEDKPTVRLTVGRDFTPELEIEPARPKDLVLDLGALVIALDPASARRADGLSIDFVEGKEATGFRIENPNAPPKVRPLSVEEFARWRTEGKPHLLLDVRTPGEWDAARIDGARLVDDEVRAELEELDRSRTLVVACHHGVRSRAAAEHLVTMGFRDVHNLEGGIDAWSLRIDPAVPRY